VSKGEKEPLYHLAVVVDDAAMAITHVIRGEDHISNTSKHLLLQQALAVPTPAYAHVPLLLDEKRAKLSKRSGSAETSVAAYRDAGILPQAMVNLLALLGWNPKTAEEVFTLEELVRRFRLEQVQKGGAVFSVQRLDWMNRQHLQRSTTADLFSHVRPFLERAGLEDIPRAQLLKGVEVERTRLTRLTEFPAALAFLREPLEIDARELPWQDSEPEEARSALSETRAALAALSFGVWDDRAALQRECLRVADASGKSRGAMLWPVRYAFSGKAQSAGPGDLAWVLGRAAALFRLERAEKLLTTTP
jgi:glutamyl/glutaminyl-tRNA synthetase